jgi:hypothetical protein
MSPTPDDVATETQTAVADSPSTPASADAVPPIAPAPVGLISEDVQLLPPRNLLLYTVFSFLCIGVAGWLVFAWTGYKEKHSQQTEGWYLGSTKMIEITLIREDKKNLACASDKELAGVHCGYHANAQSWGTTPETDPHVLQPFNTVKNELFLGAGLWQSPILSETLPAERFTVVCNYHVAGVLKAVSLRWSPTGNFGPVDQSVAVGTLTDCVFPQ